MDFTDFHLWLLLLVYFCTAAFAAAVGMGGGMLITGVLATMLPIQAVLPVQSILLLFNTGYRAWLYHQQISWRTAWPFIIGIALGSIAGAFVFVAIPEQGLAITMGLCLLLFTWLPERAMAFSRLVGVQFGLALVHGVLTSISGVSGILQAVLSRLNLARKAFIGTLASIMLTNNLCRLIGLSLAGGMGHALPYVSLIILAIPIGFIGAHVGKRVFDGMDERWFKRTFKVLMTLLACHLLWRAFTHT